MKRITRIVLLAILALACLLVAAAGVLLAGVEVPGEFLRAPLERALTSVFRVPTRIEGPLKLHTGRIATVSADALVLADASGPAGAILARGIEPRASIDLVALLQGAIALEEVTGERLEFELVRRAGERGNWAPLFGASRGGGSTSVSFAGIGRLRIGSVALSYQRESGTPLQLRIAAFDGALPLHEPSSARGSVEVAGVSAAVEVRSASLADFARPGGDVPLQGAVHWSGVQAAFDGGLAGDGSRFDAKVRASAQDSSQALAALGIAATRPGRMDAQLHVAVTATQAFVRDLSVTLGDSVASGSWGVAWSAPRLRMQADLVGERIDVEPFLSAESPKREDMATRALLALLERTAQGADARLELAVRELVGLPLALRDLGIAISSQDRVVGVTGEGLVSGARVRTSVDFDARDAQRSIAARVEGGRASTSQLPRDVRPGALSVSLAGVRGQLRGQGANAGAILASLHGDLEARDLHWTFARSGGESVSGRFDLARIDVQGTQASSVKVTGALGGAACTLEVSGGALAALLDGEPWPMKLDGSCPGERVSAKGRVALAPTHVGADLSFDAVADRIGSAARALGVPPNVPHPIGARGTFVLDEERAHLRLDAVRSGRTAGSGEFVFPRSAQAKPRVRLALTVLDLNEIGAIGASAPVRRDRLAIEVLPQGTPVPDLDFEIAAERVVIADAHVRRLRTSGAIRSRALPPARFRFELEGVPLSGRFGADFSGAEPSVQLEGEANDAALRAWFVRFGQSDIGLRAGRISLHARAAGVKLGALLDSMTLAVAIDDAELELPRSPAPGLSRRSAFSATFEAAPGRPARLDAHGKVGDEPMDLAVDARGLTDLGRAGEAVSLTVRLGLGDLRIDAEGKVRSEGGAEGRLRIAGDRLDRLGKLAGLQLPEASPYAAAGNLAVSAGAVHATDLSLSFGRSRAVGEMHFEPARQGGARSLTQLRLKVPALHLEDIDAGRWIRGGGEATAGEAPDSQAARREELEQALDRLPAADIDAAVEVEALYSGGERFASGRARATNEAGMLRVRLHNALASGGELDADIVVDERSEQRRIGVRLRVRDLEYEPLVRAADPDATMAGKLDLVADLAAHWGAGGLLPALAGTVDLAVYPRGLHSPALGLWGAGLLQGVLRQLDPDSKSAVECAVASLEVGAGVASSTAFFLESTRVRVIGDLEADLNTRSVSGRIWPRSKDPRLLSFAPTMLLGGTIDSVRVSVAPASIVSVPLRFATALAGFPRDWLTSGDRARDGVAGCTEAFERILQARPGAARPPGSGR